MNANDMNQTVKIVGVTFGVMSVLSLISLGWEAHEQSKREAELREVCNSLRQYTSAVQQQGDQASRIELMGWLYAQNLYSAGCENIGR